MFLREFKKGKRINIGDPKLTKPMDCLVVIFKGEVALKDTEGNVLEIIQQEGYFGYTYPIITRFHNNCIEVLSPKMLGLCLPYCRA